MFGSDSPWYGGPQWQIEALWRLQIPEAMRREFGYPELTDVAKRKILGLTSARMYKLPISRDVSARSAYKPFPADYVSKIPNSLYALLEYPGFTTQNGTAPNTASVYASDNFAKAREAYRSWDGAASRHTRAGWVRNRV